MLHQYFQAPEDGNHSAAGRRRVIFRGDLTASTPGPAAAFFAA
jgi:hypothetical protein